MQIMDKIVAYAGEIGLKIILDHHRNDSGAGASANGLWYDGQHHRSAVDLRLADAGGALRRQPDGDRRRPAQRAPRRHLGRRRADRLGGGGRARRQRHRRGQSQLADLRRGRRQLSGPALLVGRQPDGRARPADRPRRRQQAGLLGARLSRTRCRPSRGSRAADFPANLPAKFDQMWGYIYKEGIAPVYIGEFGTNLTDPKDAPWLGGHHLLPGGRPRQQRHDRHPGRQDRASSWTFWSWNPNSGDTGGILANDWNTREPEQDGVPDADRVRLRQRRVGRRQRRPARHLPADAVGARDRDGDGGLPHRGGHGGQRRLHRQQRHGDLRGRRDRARRSPSPITPDTLGRGQRAVQRGAEQRRTAPPWPRHRRRHHRRRRRGAAGRADAGHRRCHGHRRQQRHQRSSAFTVTLSAGRHRAGHGDLCHRQRHARRPAATTPPRSGTLTFAAGETTKIVTSPITGDTAVESQRDLHPHAWRSPPAPPSPTARPPAPSSTTTRAAAAARATSRPQFALADSWSSGFNGNVVVHNDGSSTTGWQIVIDMPNQITDIWNAKILSHDRQQLRDRTGRLERHARA